MNTGGEYTELFGSGQGGPHGAGVNPYGPMGTGYQLLDLGFQMFSPSLKNPLGSMFQRNSPYQRVQQWKQQQDYAQLLSAATSEDGARLQALAYQAARHTMGRDASEEAVRATATDATDAAMRFFNDGTVQQMGLSNTLLNGLLGGTSALAMAQPLSAAMLNFKGTTARATTEDSIQLMKSLMSEYGVAGSLMENTSFTRGLSTGDMGQLTNEMSRRGLLDAFGGEGADVKGSLGQFNATKVKQQLGEMAKVVDAMRDLTGDPDAPIPQIIDSLQKITGGSLGKISTQQMESIVYRANNLASEMNMDAGAVQYYMASGAERSKRDGYGGMAGSLANLDTMTTVAASLRVREDQKIVGGSSNDERMNIAQSLGLGAVNSVGINRVTALVRAEATGGLKGDSELAKLVRAVKDGTASSADVQKLMGMVETDNDFSAAVSKEGLNPMDMHSLMNDTKGQGSIMAKYDIAKTMTSAAISRDMGLSLSNLLRNRGLDPAKNKAVTDAVMSGRGSNDDIRATLASALGSGTTAEAVMADFRDINGAGMDDVVQLYGTQALAAKDRIQRESVADIGITQMLKDSGLGGVSGVMRNILNAIGQNSAGTGEIDLGKLLSTSLSGTKMDEEKVGLLANSVLNLRKAKMAEAGLGSDATPEARETARANVQAMEAEVKKRSEILIALQAEINARNGSTLSNKMANDVAAGRKALKDGNVERAVEKAALTASEMSEIGTQASAIGGEYEKGVKGSLDKYQAAMEDQKNAALAGDDARHKEATARMIELKAKLAQKTGGEERTKAEQAKLEAEKEAAAKPTASATTPKPTGAAPVPAGDTTRGGNRDGMNVTKENGDKLHSGVTREIIKSQTVNSNTNTPLGYGTREVEVFA